MSKVRLSKATFCALLGLAVLGGAGCNRQPDVNSPQVRGIGYVRLDDLVKKHPLYNQLAQIDSSIDALNLAALGPSVPKTGADLARQTEELNKELNAARDRANKTLRQKQIDYAQREQQAIRAAIAASGENPGQSPGASIQQEASNQAATIAAQANADFNTYQQTVIAQDRAAAQTVSQQLQARANRQYRQKADELANKESQLSLEMQSRDAAQHLALQTKLSNLALDDATRAQVKAQLAALNKREQDAVAAMRVRDNAELATYQATLRTQTAAQIAQQMAQIHAQTNAKLNSHRNAVSSQISSQIKTLPAAPPAQQGGLSPATQAKIAQIDKQYKAQFRADVGKTIADFNRVKSDLDARFAALHGVDGGARGSVARQIDALHKQRDQLYAQILAQVQKEVKDVAAARGLRVVFINVVAPAGGIDLTDDVMKNVESLHE